MSVSVTQSAQTEPLKAASVVETFQDGDGHTIHFVIRQDPMSITLDGPAIFTIATSLILGLHFLQPSLVALFTALLPIVLFVKNDYQNFLKLGPGGSAPTFKGYLWINWFKLWALRDPFTPPESNPNVEPSAGILSKNPLPYRCGPRPTVAGIAPQRQLDQHGSRDCYLALRRILQNHSSKHSETIGIGTSCFEKHGLGLFARFPFNNTCQGEICHVHNSDHSMHMNLHPDDIKELLLKGWGQRHPMAYKGFLRMPVPAEFVMVYAPRTRDELEVVCRIISAAGYWVMAKEVKIDTMVGAGAA